MGGAFSVRVRNFVQAKLIFSSRKLRVAPRPFQLFANPIGEDYPVRGFDGNIYTWDDDWDDNTPSDEIDAVH